MDNEAGGQCSGQSHVLEDAKADTDDDWEDYMINGIDPLHRGNTRE